MKKKKVYLTLENGEVFQGYRFGANGNVTGELVFSTGMVGYVETLTDPSNLGQIVVQTFPLVGNYGVNESDAESERAWVSAYVVREYCETPSNFRSEISLDAYLKKQGVIGLYGVDTRRLTKILREEGVMNARISDKPAVDEYDDTAAFFVKDAVQTVAPTEYKTYGGENAKYTVALWNFGAKKSTIDCLVAQNCRVISVPAFATAEGVLKTSADGVLLSDGPGDPMENQSIVKEVKALLGKKPVLGVGLGHQLVALALGAETAKCKYGHRGSNQPVKCLETGKVYISTQNHGYQVIEESIKTGKVAFMNVNDGDCEGIVYEEWKAFTTQFAPESCNDFRGGKPVLEKFFTLMRKEKENA